MAGTKNTNYGIRVEGYQPINRRLTRLEQKAGKKALLKAVRTGAKLYRDLAKSMVPRRSGLLKKALGAFAKTYPSGISGGLVVARRGFRRRVMVKQRTVKMGGTYKGGRGAVRKVKPIWANPQFYAHLAERGRKPVVAGINSKTGATGKRVLSEGGVNIFGKRSGRAKGQPFMEPAYQSGTPLVQAMIRTTVGKEIEKAGSTG